MCQFNYLKMENINALWLVKRKINEKGSKSRKEICKFPVGIENPMIPENNDLFFEAFIFEIFFIVLRNRKIFFFSSNLLFFK